MSQIPINSQSKINLRTILQDMVLGTLIAVITCGSFYIALVKSDEADEHKTQAQAEVRAEVVK